jgi:hypothetical protein
MRATASAKLFHLASTHRGVGIVQEADLQRYGADAQVQRLREGALAPVPEVQRTPVLARLHVRCAIKRVRASAVTGNDSAEGLARNSLVWPVLMVTRW